MVDALLVLGKLLFSALLGGLVGVEREFNRQLRKEIPIGLRTMIFITLFGTASVVFYEVVANEFILLISFSGMILFTALSYYARYREYKQRGLTTYTAALIMYLVGLLIGLNEFLVAVIISVFTAVVLSMKPELHGLVAVMKRSELKATILFVVIALVVLPLLPDAAIDPFGLFNPFQFWFIVVLISGLSFASYLLLKFYHQGLSIVGLLGGIVSSKTTINELSIKSKNVPSLRDSAFNGSLLAIASSIIADLILILLIVREPVLLLNMIPLIIISCLIVLVFFKRQAKQGSYKLNFKNPFTISSALKSALLIFGFTQGMFLIKELIDPSLVYLAVGLTSLANSAVTAVSIATLLLAGGLSARLFTQLMYLNALMTVFDKLLFSRLGGDQKLVKQLFKPVIIWIVMILIVLLIY